MEGFLFKKARGESTFGRHNWKLRWFLLESTSLSYFESFDTGSNKPNDVKGLFPTDGCTIKDIKHDDFDNAFLVSHPNRKPLMLAAETSNLKKLWVKAIMDSSTLAPGATVGALDPSTYLETLGIQHKSFNRERTLSSLNDVELESAFKFRALQTDPSHGGDSHASEQVHEVRLNFSDTGWIPNQN